MPKTIVTFIGCAALSVALLSIWKSTAKAQPWQLPTQMAEPGAMGVRINSGALIGNYFAVSRTSPGPAILIFGGSEGGLSEAVTRHARALQQAGYSTFHFSWWRAPGQAPSIGHIPIENFEAALDWLKAQPEVDPNRIAVFGWSRGSEPAQLMSVRHPELAALVLGMPANAVWPGFDWNFMGPQPEHAWILDGKPYASVPRRVISGIPMQQWSDNRFEAYMRYLETQDDALIPIEQIKSPVLLICGQADRIWPSCQMARELKNRAQRLGKANVHLLSYEGAGHMAYGAPVAPNDPSFARQAQTGGGDAAANAAALNDSFEKTLVFLKTAFDK